MKSNAEPSRKTNRNIDAQEQKRSRKFIEEARELLNYNIVQKFKMLRNCKCGLDTTWLENYLINIQDFYDATNMIEEVNTTRMDDSSITEYDEDSLEMTIKIEINQDFEEQMEKLDTF